MNKNWYLAPALGAVLLAVVQPVAAHRSWLLPSAGVVDGKGQWVTVDAAVSEDYFHLGANSVKLDGLIITGPDGKAVSPANTATGKLRSTFDVELAQEGTYRVSIANEGAMANYKLGAETKRWRGPAAELAQNIPKEAQELRTTVTHARLETFVTAGRGNDVALQPSCQGLEVQLLTHPEDFLPGQLAKFRLLLDGKGLPSTTVSVVRGGVRYRGVLREQAFTTDAKGEFAVKWVDAGMYAVSASYPPRAAMPPQTAPGVAPAPASTGGGVPTRRYTYTGTLEVLPQ